MSKTARTDVLSGRDTGGRSAAWYLSLGCLYLCCGVARAGGDAPAYAEAQAPPPDEASSPPARPSQAVYAPRAVRVVQYSLGWGVTASNFVIAPLLEGEVRAHRSDLYGGLLHHLNAALAFDPTGQDPIPYLHLEYTPYTFQVLESDPEHTFARLDLREVYDYHLVPIGVWRDTALNRQIDVEVRMLHLDRQRLWHREGRLIPFAGIELRILGYHQARAVTGQVFEGIEVGQIGLDGGLAVRLHPDWALRLESAIDGELSLRPWWGLILENELGARGRLELLYRKRLQVFAEVDYRRVVDPASPEGLDRLRGQGGVILRFR